MLTENDVIIHVCNYLKSRSYTIDRTATTTQRGIDIVAVNGKEKLYIEAKGETSSKTHTKRFGNQFSNSQVSTHIAMATLYGMITLNENPGVDFAFAFPDNTDHTKMIDRILPSLKKLGINVYFVSANGAVRII